MCTPQNDDCYQMQKEQQQQQLKWKKRVIMGEWEEEKNCLYQ